MREWRFIILNLSYEYGRVARVTLRLARACLGVLEKRKISYLSGKSNHSSFDIQPVA